MIAALLLSTLLSLTDPAGDAVGNGTVSAPTATAFRNTDAFDIRTTEVPDAGTFSFRLEMGALPPPEAFAQAIVELYLHDADALEPGQNALLPGSGMRLPEGVGWHLAFRLIGDSLSVYAPTGPTDEGLPLEVSEALGARVEVENNTLVVTTSTPTPQRFSLYGLSGAYDPFSDSGWRALRREPSPWGFSSVDQQFPVLDVIADTYAQQQQALAQGVLPEIRASFAQERWLLLTGAGILLAFVGLTARFFVRDPRQKLHQEPRPGIPIPGLLAPITPSTLAARAGALRALQAGRGSLHPHVPDPALNTPDAHAASPSGSRKPTPIVVVRGAKAPIALSGRDPEEAAPPAASTETLEPHEEQHAELAESVKG